MTADLLHKNAPPSQSLYLKSLLSARWGAIASIRNLDSVDSGPHSSHEVHPNVMSTKQRFTRDTGEMSRAQFSGLACSMCEYIIISGINAACIHVAEFSEIDEIMTRMRLHEIAIRQRFFFVIDKE